MGALRAPTVRRLAIFAVLVATLSGCTGSPFGVDDVGEAVGGDPAEAAGIVEEWITRAQANQGDLGWSLIFPAVQRDLIGSFDIYREAVLASDWTMFDYDIGDVGTVDGEYRVSIRVPGGEVSLPSFMRKWGFIQFPLSDGQPSETGLVVVRIPPFGTDRGIQAIG